MAIRKWITKREVADILKTYSIRPNEFEQCGSEGYFYMSKHAKGYSISISPEVQHGTANTGRIIVSHAKNGGKRTFCDVWERDADGKLQFLFRNPQDVPPADYEYIENLKDYILTLQESGQKLQHQLEKSHGLINDTNPAPELQELTALRDENASLRRQVDDLSKKYEELIKKTGHNVRGAGRKADLARLEAKAEKIMDLMAAGKTAVEIQKILGISRSTFFKYKKFIKEKGS